MHIDTDSNAFRILERLCRLPKPVRSMSDVMLNAEFHDPQAIQALAEAGLIRERGWDQGPGTLWVPTPAGERLYAAQAGKDTAAG